MKILAVLAVAMMAFTVFATVDCSSDYYAEGSVTNEAKIGETEYATLTAAIGAAVTGNEIVLLKDITSSAQYVVDKAITLNGDGKTITSTASGNGAILIASSGVTVENITVVGPNTNPSGWNGGEYGIKVFGSGISGIVLDTVTVTGANAGILVNGGVALEGVITVSGNEFGGIEVSKSGTNPDAVGSLAFGTGASVVCTDSNVPAMWVDEFNAKYSGNLSSAVTGIPSSMKTAVLTTKDQCYIATDDYAFSAFEAKLGQVYYETLTEALTKSVADNTITLQKDISSSAQYVINKAITFDGNNKTITSTSSGNSAILISYSGVIVKNLKVIGPNTDSPGWNEGKYGIEVFGSGISGIVLDTVTVTGADAGILVNGGVTIKGVITVSGNEFGGIEVSKSSTDSTAVGKLTFFSNASVVCTDASVPAIWVDGFNTDYGGKLSDAVVSVPTSMKATIPDNKDQYYIVTDSYDLSACEAAIGVVHYSTLAGSLGAATSGQTVKLLKKCTYSGTGTFTANENVKIDGNKKTLTMAATATDLKTGTSFSDITFVAAGTGNLFTLTSGLKNITFTTCTFSGDSTGNDMCYIQGSDYKGKLTVDRCIFVNSGDKISRDISVTIQESATSADTKVTVTGCTMSLGSGTDIATPVAISGKTLPALYAMTENTLGGAALVTAHDGAKVVLITEASCDAKIGDFYYTAISGAFSKLTSAQTLTVLRNCSVNASVSVAQNCELIIANGKALTIDGSSASASLTLALARGASVDGKIAYKESATSSNSAIFDSVVAGENGLIITKGSMKITGTIDASQEASITTAGALVISELKLSQTGTDGGLALKKTSGGTITLDKVTVNSGAVLDLETNVTVNTTMTVNGTVAVEKGTTLINNGTISGSGVIDNEGTIGGTGKTEVEVINPVQPGNHRITVKTSGSEGTASSTPAKEAAPNTVVKLTYEVKTEGYGFKEWKAPEGVTIANNTFTMPDEDVTVTAVFEETYKVDIKIEGVDKSKVSVSAKPSSAFKGDSVTLSYTTSTGYYFKEWKAPEGVTITNNTFTMPDKDVTVTAVFGQYQDVVKTVENGSVTIPWALAKDLKITDVSKLNLKIEKVDSPKQSNIPKDAKTFEISLSYGTTSFTSFSDKIEIALYYTIPDGAKVSDYKVYFVSEDGKTVTDMDAKYDASGKFTFKTDHLSTYSISPKVIQPATDGPNWLIIIVIAAAVVIVAVVAFFFLNNRKKTAVTEDDYFEEY